ncbi:ULP-PROTEASE domain-containing protein [Mycena venus]|uniref:ULP-PROTEASE domain-containing protein n=1 Tax=Mycena venus TaxID=2733690 RepID=A0A8H7DAV0_9AGAR|nr:ULP-PROTEASE domain-containing protein [Mycena venus]
MQSCDASARRTNSNTEGRGGGGNLVAQRTVVEFVRSGPPPKKKVRLDNGASGSKVSHPSNRELQPRRLEDPDVIDVDSLFESDELILTAGASGSARRRSKAIATEGATTTSLPKGAGEQRSLKSKTQGLDELNTHPFLDLSKLPSANARIKNRMKPKNFSTTRVKNQKPKPKPTSEQPNTTAVLPVKAWYLGRKLFEEPYHLVWTASGKMTIRSGDGPNATPSKHSEQIDLSLCAEQVFFVEPGEPCPDKVFVLKTSEMSKANGHKPIGAQCSPYFKQGGSHGEGEILIKFDSASSAWTNALYAQFVQWLQGIVKMREKLRSKAGEAKWEAARRMAEIMENRIRRQTGGPAPSDVTVRTKSPAAPATNPAKPPSRPRSRRQGSPNTPIEVGSPTRAYPFRRRPKSADSDTASRSATPLVAPQQPCVDPDEVILVYPPGQTGAVNITNGDVSRLAPDQLLNDTLVEFGLKLWLQDLGKENPELVKQIHVFSSFFYKKLAEDDNKEGSSQERFEKGYENVRKWTAKFDLFDKKYIIVPINEDLHWYLAIIYQPEHTLKPPLPPPRPPSTKSPSTPSTGTKTRQQVQESPEIEVISNKPRPPGSKTRCTPSPLETTVSVGDPETSFPGSNMEEAEVTGRLVSSSADSFACDTAEKAETCDIDGDFDSLFESDDEGMDVEVVEAPVEQPPPPAGSHDGGPPAGPADAEVMDVDDPDQSMDPLLIGVDPEPPAAPIVLDPVETTSFYSSAKSRGKRKAESPPLETFPPTREAISSDTSEDEAEDGQPSTCVFTLDSLGTPHDEAVSVLGNYLQLEAREKKGISIEMSRKPVGKKALVPYQRNNFDCGIYLIHLAQTFISDPEHYHNLITRTTRMNSKKRQIEWRDEQIKTLRWSLTERIGELSLEWKKNRPAPKELKRDI